MARLGTAFVSVAGDFSTIHKQMAAQAGPLGRGGGKLGKAVGAGLVAGVAAAGVGKALFDIGSKFDDAYDKIRVGTGATGKRLKGLQGDFKAVVKDVPTDFGSASTVIADLNTRLGLSGKPLRRFSKQMLELSRITDTEVGENVESVTRLFGDWSIKTGKQSKTLDKLFRVSQATGIGVSDLSRSMVQFGSPLRQLGFDFDRAAAMFALFEKEGVNVQTLMPGLKFALKNLSGATPKTTEELKKLGVSLKDPSVALEQVFKLLKDAPSDLKANELAFKVFGQRAGPDMAAAVREGRFDLDKLLKTMRGGKDTIRGAGRDTQDLAEKWIMFKNQAMVGLEPIATRVFKKVAVEADKLFKVLADPKLTFDEKFEKVLDQLSDLIEKAVPKIADAAAKAAPKVAKAFVKGFIHAGVWGQLLAGAWVMKKVFGGKVVLQAAASAAGGTAAGSYIVGLAGGLRARGGRIKDVLRKRVLGGAAAGGAAFSAGGAVAGNFIASLAGRVRGGGQRIKDILRRAVLGGAVAGGAASGAGAAVGGTFVGSIAGRISKVGKGGALARSFRGLGRMMGPILAVAIAVPMLAELGRRIDRWEKGALDRINRLAGGNSRTGRLLNRATKPARDFLNPFDKGLIDIPGVPGAAAGGLVTPRGIVRGYAAGGAVGRMPKVPAGEDTWGALRFGEFVQRRDTVQREGKPAMRALNEGQATIIPKNAGLAATLEEDRTKATGPLKNIAADLDRLAQAGRHAGEKTGEGLLKPLTSARTDVAVIAKGLREDVTGETATMAKRGADAAGRFRREVGGEFAATRVDVAGNARDMRQSTVRVVGDMHDRLSHRFAGIRKDGDRATGRLRRAVGDNFAGMRQDGDRATGRLRNAVGDNFAGASRSVGRETRQMLATTADRTGAMARVGRQHTDRLEGSIGSSMGSASRAVFRGMDYIATTANKALKAFDAKPVKLSIAGPGGKAGDGDKKSKRGRARGGLVQFGQAGAAGRDTIPANIGGQDVAVGSGEVAAVFNRHQLPVLDAKLADDGGLRGFFAKHDRPHYMARGGYVQGAVPPSGRAVRNLASQMFAKGFNVTSAYRSDSSTYHGSGDALDFGDSVNDMGAVWGALMPRRKQLAELFGPSALPGAPSYRHGVPGPPVPAHEDHVHTAIVDALRGALGRGRGGGSAGGAGAGAVWDAVKKLKVRGTEGSLRDLTQAGLDKVVKGANAYGQKKAGAAGGGGPSGAGTAAPKGSVRQWLTQALKITGHFSPANLNALYGRAMQESGGNPRAQNNWDSNAAAGIPSKGLLQTIGPTFAQYKMRGMNNILNPIHNAVAAIRYMMAKYGRIVAASGTGYARGGIVGSDGASIADFMPALAEGGMVGGPRGRYPSREQVVGQKRETTQAQKRLKELRAKADPKKKKALEKLEKSRAAAKKDYGGQRRKLKTMRRRRKAGKGRQSRRQARLSGLLAGLDLPQGLIGRLEGRGVELEDAEAIYGQVEGTYRADERITPETLRSLLGPDMGGLSADDQKGLIGSTQSILTPPELNDLLGRQQGLLTGYQNQHGLAARIRDTIQERIPKVEGLLTKLRARAKANMDELRRRLKEAKRLREEMEDKRKRLKTIGDDVAEIRKKKKPTDADRKRRERLGREAEAIRDRIPRIANRLGEIGARVPVLEGDNSFLTGEKRPAALTGENVEGLIGEGQTVLTENLRGRLPDFTEMLRPGGLPQQIHEYGRSIAGLKLEGAWSPERSDPAGSDDASEDESAGLWRELLQQQTQRLAVSERQFDVLRNFPPAFAGSFHTGGIVPGPASQERMALVKGQETIRTVEQERALAPAGVAASDVQVVVHGDIVSDRRDPVEVMVGDRRFAAAVKKVTRGESASAIRGLPSGGGRR